MIRILVADKLAKEGVEELARTEGVEVDVQFPISEDELIAKIGNYDGLIVRSSTKVTARVLANPGKLRAIARAGVGVDTIDVAAATRKGIVVMNTPDGNTLATAEQTFTVLLALCRHVVRACSSLKAGKWERSLFMGTQLAGKTLGVVGLGRIGRAVAARAIGFDMKVVGYDPYFSLPADKLLGGGVEIVDDLRDFCSRCDVITVHTPLTDQTRGLIGKDQLEAMIDGVRIVNCARAGIIDEEALYEALQSGKVAGAALDVYSKEPPEDRRLIELDNVVCTPHLGASTREAQVLVALDAGKQLVAALSRGDLINAVNVPGYDKSLSAVLRPYVQLGQRMGVILGRITSGRLKKLTVSYQGELAEMDTSCVTRSLMVGVLADHTDEPVNVISAPLFAREQGIEIQEISSHAVSDFSSLIEARLITDKASRSISGTVFSKSLYRIVGLDDYRMEVVPAGRMIVTFNDDRAGVIGEVGSLFGRHGVNIGSLTFARQEQTGKAVLVLTLDSEPAKEVMEELAGLSFMDSVHFIHLPEVEGS